MFLVLLAILLSMALLIWLSLVLVPMLRCVVKIFLLNLLVMLPVCILRLLSVVRIWISFLVLSIMLLVLLNRTLVLSVLAIRTILIVDLFVAAVSSRGTWTSYLLDVTGPSDTTEDFSLDCWCHSMYNVCEVMVCLVIIP